MMWTHCGLVLEWLKRAAAKNWKRQKGKEFFLLNLDYCFYQSSLKYHTPEARVWVGWNWPRYSEHILLLLGHREHSLARWHTPSVKSRGDAAVVITSELDFTPGKNRAHSDAPHSLTMTRVPSPPPHHRPPYTFCMSARGRPPRKPGPRPREPICRCDVCVCGPKRDHTLRTSTLLCVLFCSFIILQCLDPSKPISLEILQFLPHITNLTSS